MVHAEALEILLGPSRFLPGIQQSSRWLRERSIDNSDFPRLTRCLSAFAPIDTAEDIEFRIRTSWFDGWEIINSLGFEDSRETDVILL